MGKKKDETGDPTPTPSPEPKPSPEPGPKVNPSSGERVDEEWRKGVDAKLDGLTQSLASQGKAIEAWGQPDTVDPEPKPKPKPEPGKTEPLDPWAG